MSKLISLLDQVVNDGRAAGVGHFTLEDERLGGRTITLDGARVLNFGSCSYLGLEMNERLVEGTIDAVRRFGTQFSSSRAFASVTLYGELEVLLQGMFGQPAIVTASTTLGHLATLPVLVGDDDAVILDHQVHSSIQMTVQQLKARGIPSAIVRHNDMAHLERTILQLKPTAKKIWYLADGIYSMYGDAAPLDAIQDLLARHEQLHFYVDDAHGMSWTGDNGVGFVRSRMPHHPRMVQAVSLNKAFAAGGGVILFPDEASKQLVRNCGSTLLFSGPVQPPMLGAALASARLHLDDELTEHQARLAERITHMNRRLNEAGLPQFDENDSPLFFVPAGLPHLDYAIVRRMLADGFYVNAAVFPAVPMKRGGLRFTVTNHLELADIDAMVDALARHYTAALAEAGVTFDDVAANFRISPFSVRGAEEERSAPAATLWAERAKTIDAFDPSDWDRHARGRGNFTHAALRVVESVFAGHTPTADRWPFQYFTVRDASGSLVLRSFFTVARIKDDMFEPAAVSRQVEAERMNAPEHLTSVAVVLGSMVTKGEHLVIDRAHPAWREALAMLVDEMEAVRERFGATQILMRDFVGPRDEALENALLALGLVVTDLPDNHAIDALDWEDHDGYVASLDRRYRSDLRREILRNADAFEVRTGPMSDSELVQAYSLYRRVFERSFELNVFELPIAFFRAMRDDPAYDVLRLYLHRDDTAPVAVMFSHFEGRDYNAMFVGLEDRAIEEHGAYKQILYRTVLRARELGAQRLDLAFTAKLAKRKVGASPQPARAFVRVEDHFNAAVIEALPRAVDVRAA